MTTRDWNAGIEYLENGKIGDYIEYNGREIVIGNMAGGRYERYENDEFCGVTDTEWRAMDFLRTGRII